MRLKKAPRRVLRRGALCFGIITFGAVVPVAFPFCVIVRFNGEVLALLLLSCAASARKQFDIQNDGGCGYCKADKKHCRVRC